MKAQFKAILLKDKIPAKIESLYPFPPMTLAIFVKRSTPPLLYSNPTLHRIQYHPTPTTQKSTIQPTKSTPPHDTLQNQKERIFCAIHLTTPTPSNSHPPTKDQPHQHPHQQQPPTTTPPIKIPSQPPLKTTYYSQPYKEAAKIRSRFYEVKAK